MTLHAEPPRFIVSADLGQAHDYTAIGLIEHVGEGKLNLNFMDRLPLKTPYPAQVARLVEMVTDERVASKCVLAVDATGVGRPVMDMLGVALAKVAPRPSVYAVTITGGDTAKHEGGNWRVPKRDLIAAAQVAMQQGRVKSAAHPDWALLRGEMTAYKVKIATDGHDTYGNDWREAPNDDLVLMLAIGCYVAGRIWSHGPARTGARTLRRTVFRPDLGPSPGGRLQAPLR
jgi:hypothetical protein